jgi:hypothetical protein
VLTTSALTGSSVVFCSWCAPRAPTGQATTPPGSSWRSPSSVRQRRPPRDHDDHLLVAVVEVERRAVVARIDLVERRTEPLCTGLRTDASSSPDQRRLGTLDPLLRLENVRHAREPNSRLPAQPQHLPGRTMSPTCWSPRTWPNDSSASPSRSDTLALLAAHWVRDILRPLLDLGTDNMPRVRDGYISLGTRGHGRSARAGDRSRGHIAWSALPVEATRVTGAVPATTTVSGMRASVLSRRTRA